jgi:hypothetical protein
LKNSHGYAGNSEPPDRIAGVGLGVVCQLESQIVAGIAREHEIAQGDDEIACLRVYLFKRLEVEVIAVLLGADAIEL